MEELRYTGFGKTIVFTDMHSWHFEKIAKTYNRKYLVENDLKLQNDVLLVPVGPINHHKDFNIRAHIFLCIIGMIFYRYLAWKCKYPGLSLRRLVEELGEFVLLFCKVRRAARLIWWLRRWCKTSQVVISAGFGEIYGKVGKSIAGGLMF